MDPELEQRQVDSQKTVYVKYPSSSKAPNPVIAAKLEDIAKYKKEYIPFQRLLNGQESTESLIRRYLLFLEYWSQCEQTINEISDEYNRPILEEIISTIKAPINKGVSGDEILGIKAKISTTLLLTGTNIAKDDELFGGLASHIDKSYPEIKLITLDVKGSGDNIASVLKTIAYSLVGLSLGSSILTRNFSFDSLTEYCREYYEEEGEGITVENTLLRIVIFVKNLNAFSQPTLVKFLRMVQESGADIPFKLVLNFASFSVEYMESTLIGPLRQLLLCNTIRVTSDNTGFVDAVFRKLILEPKGPHLIFGPDVVKSLASSFVENNGSVQMYVSEIRYLIMSHFFSQPLILEVDLGVSSGKEKAGKLFQSLYQYFCQLPSLRSYMDTIREKEPETFQQIAMRLFGKQKHSEKWEYIKEHLLPRCSSEMAQFSERLSSYIGLLITMQNVIERNNNYLIENNLVLTNTTRQSLAYEKTTALVLCSYLLGDEPAFTRFAKKLCSTLTTLIPRYYVELVESLVSQVQSNPSFASFFKLIESMLQSAALFGPNGKYHYLSESPLDGLRELPVQGKIKYENSVEALVHEIETELFLLKPHNIFTVKEAQRGNYDFTNSQELLGAEIYIISKIEPAITLKPPYRAVLEEALSRAEQYIPKRGESIEKPLLVEMFKLYREAPMTINIYDYYESFEGNLDQEKYITILRRALNGLRATCISQDPAVVETINEVMEEPRGWKKMVLAIFIQHIADLKYMGFFRPISRTVDVMDKAVWKTAYVPSKHSDAP